jgi:hypothetical protein
MFCVGVLFACTSCSENVLPDYSGDDAIYFYHGTYGGNINVFQRDSIIFSFISSGLKERDTVYIDVRTMGDIQPRPRPFRVEQIDGDEESAAQPGVHYVPFDDPEMLALTRIPANATQYAMPVILLRDPTLQEQTVRLRMALVENEEFKIGIDKQAIFCVRFADQFMPTDQWPLDRENFGWAFYFGKYGERKHWFLVTYVGFSDFTANPADYPNDVRKFYNQQAREKLAAYNAVNPTLKERNGEDVTFPVYQ